MTAKPDIEPIPIEDAKPVAEMSDEHPHEPRVHRQLDVDGRCLVCDLVTNMAAAQSEIAERLDETLKDRDAWRTQKMPDGEAEAIARCVKALDELTSRKSGSNYSTPTATVYWTVSGEVRRVLRYLADRYGVIWYEPPTDTEVDT